VLVPAHDDRKTLTGGTLLLPQNSRRLPVDLQPTGRDDSWALVVHLRAVDDGDDDEFGFSAARVDYTVGGHHYRLSFERPLSASESLLCYGAHPPARVPAAN